MLKLLKEREELQQELQVIETEYYMDSQNFDEFTLEEYIEMRLDDILGA